MRAAQMIQPSAPDPAGTALLARLAASSAAAARLDERLAASPEPVRRGFLNRLLIEDAAASARLMDLAVDADEVRLADAGALAGDDPNDERGRRGVDAALEALVVLRAVARRRPIQLFTPRRLIAAARLRLRGRQDLVQSHGVPVWLVKVPDPEEAREALRSILAPSVVAAWKAMPPLLAAADLLARFDREAPYLAHVGRALVPQMLVRLGATGLPCIPGSLGFVKAVWSYRPDRRDGWPEASLDASGRAVNRGLALHAEVAEAHRRLHAVLRRGHGPDIADHLTAVPWATGASLARAVGISGVAARAALAKALDAHAVRELTGRDAFRLYGAA